MAIIYFYKNVDYFAVYVWQISYLQNDSSSNFCTKPRIAKHWTHKSAYGNTSVSSAHNPVQKPVLLASELTVL